MKTIFPDIAKSKFAGAIALEEYFPRSIRRILRRIAAVLLALILARLLPLALEALRSSLGPGAAMFLRPLEDAAASINFIFSGVMGSTWSGIVFILVAILGALAMLECLANAKTGDKRGDASSQNTAERFTLRAAQFWHRARLTPEHADTKALVASLPRTTAGHAMLTRLGIPPREHISAIAALVAQDTNHSPLPILLESLGTIAGAEGEITFAHIISALFETDSSLKNFLIQKGYTQEMTRACAGWMEEQCDTDDDSRRWWSRRYLGRIPGLAKNLAYGQTPLLKMFAAEISDEDAIGPEDLIGHERSLQLIESALLKQSGANVVIVGEPGSGKQTLLAGLARLIRTGTIFPELEHKRVFQLHTASLTASGKTKGETEALLLRLLHEAVRAGNVILAIENFPEFVQSLSALGVNAVEILSPYLVSPAIHVIALADTLSWRRILETDAGLMKNFEKIELSEPDDATLIRILERAATKMETDFALRAIFTYAALASAAQGASQYMVNGGMPQRAINLMQEIMETATRKKMHFILPDLVQEIISQKTNVPLGAMDKGEQEKLVHLEEVLHERIIGQDEAVTAVADAIRRSRSGIQNPKRPVGTFLFMGPTGVGKTETAKALAATYFGSEEAMMRFDMTEYHAPDSVERLIGSFAQNEPGILASKMRSSPYGVVLLDEFEKAHLEVRNLFLQILDEGFFSDYLGTRVNMRNTIIIATSNAGSALIARLVAQNIDHAALVSQVMAEVQNQNIMSPELLNRFDAIVIFRPLDADARRAIARLMLAGLAARLKKQNLLMTITDELVGAVASGGYDPAFGARPMQRFIQDHIEKTIAEKILRSEIKPGIPFSL